jgi:hypothetical protein
MLGHWRADVVSTEGFSFYSIKNASTEVGSASVSTKIISEAAGSIE